MRTTCDGHCTCRSVRFRITSEPLFVHCCHCRWCQRETGTAFALNAMIEADRVLLLQGNPVIVVTPSNSGKGQKIARCPVCHVALWSNYAGAGDAVRFVRVWDDTGFIEEFPVNAGEGVEVVAQDVTVAIQHRVTE